MILIGLYSVVVNSSTSKNFLNGDSLVFSSFTCAKIPGNLPIINIPLPTVQLNPISDKIARWPHQYSFEYFFFQRADLQLQWQVQNVYQSTRIFCKFYQLWCSGVFIVISVSKTTYFFIIFKKWLTISSAIL